MGTLYLREQGAKVSRQGRRLVVSKDQQEIMSIPLHRLTRLVFLGRIQITESALALLLDRRIPLVLTTHTGRLRGVLCPPDTPHVELRQNQYALARDPAYSLEFCKDLVDARAVCCISIIKRYAYNHPDPELDRLAAQIQTYRSQLNTCQTIESVRGIEGICSRDYVAALVRIFSSLQMHFSGRIRRPPTDPVNAVLSFVYVLLTELCSSALQITRLDVFCGLMHAPNRNAPALALDFVEQFRQPLADRFVMLMFNKKILKAEDFGNGPQYAVLLKEDPKKRLLAEWERFLDAPQRLADRQTFTNARELIFQQAEKLETAIMNKTPYVHYRLSVR